jgi:hypothetical protein
LALGETIDIVVPILLEEDADGITWSNTCMAGV